MIGIHLKNLIMWPALFEFLLVILSVEISFCQKDKGFDAYQILGVSKNASPANIRQAYKKLALKWHPDRNSDENAGDVFTQINQAYEILSDDNKRKQYDMFGRYEENLNNQQHRTNFDFFNFPFGGEFSRSSQETKQFYAKYLINSNVLHKIKKGSNTQPFLIYIYSQFCYACVMLNPIWKEAVNDLEEIGYGIAMIDYFSDGRLTEHIRVYHLPTIVAVSEEDITYLKPGRFTNRNFIKQFAKDSLPNTLMQQLKSYSQLRRFLEQWSKSNKISVLILGSKEEPRIRHILAAMKYRNFANFAYIHLSNPSSEIIELRRVLDIRCHDCENVLVFNDEPDAGYVARISSVSGSHVKIQDLHKIINANKFLPFPRIVSNEYFDELCPISHRDDKQFCIIFMVNHSDRSSVKLFRNSLKSFVGNISHRFRFSHVFVENQPDFVSAFKFSAGLHVFMLWRYENSKFKYLHIPSSLFDDDFSIEHKKQQLKKNLEALSKTLLYEGQVGEFRSLVDEYVPSIFKSFSKATFRLYRDMKFILANDDFVQVISVVGTIIFIIFAGYVLRYFSEKDDRKSSQESNTTARSKCPTSEQDWHPEDPKTALTESERQHRMHKRIWKTMEPMIHELRAETYFGLIRLLKPGCRSVIVLVDSDSKDILMPIFARQIYPLRSNKTFSFGYLMTDKNLEWFRSLLELTLPIDEPAKVENSSNARGSVSTGSTASTYASNITSALATPILLADHKIIESIEPEKIDSSKMSPKDRLKAINPKQTLGTVLVLCGWKLYFCMYHPMHCPVMECQKDESDSDSDNMFKSLDKNLRNRKMRTSIARKKASSLITVLDGFSMFLDRLLEGSVRRYYIPEWPDNLK